MSLSRVFLPSQTVLRKVDRWIDAHKKDLVDLTCRLVSIDTTVPPGLNYPKISQVLAGELKELGVTPSVTHIPEATIKRKVSPEVGLKGPRPNTYAILKGEGDGPKILLNGHVDVVPADPSGWTNDPFKPTIRNGQIYGRGAADMKGSDACTIFSLKALVETGAKFAGSITTTFTTDEEVGGYTGVNHLVDKHVITKDINYCISTDSGIEVLHVASLGDSEFVITVKGEAAHSGRGWTGINAIEEAAGLIEKLKVLGGDTPPAGSQGSTDMAVVSQLGIPVAVLGATRQDSNIHGIDEHVRINDLVSVTKILTHSYLELLPIRRE